MNIQQKDLPIIWKILKREIRTNRDVRTAINVLKGFIIVVVPAMLALILILAVA